MGLCLSVQSASVAELPTAKIVTAGGDLRQYSVAVTAADALLHLDPGSGESAAASFLCNSDALLFDEPAPALLPWERLQLGQVYFALPRSMLRRPLAAAEMGALAARAGWAMSAAEGGGSRRRGAKRMKICPVVDAGGDEAGFDKTRAAKLSRSSSSSVRRLQRSASRRTRMAVRSFRSRLSTIQEGTVAA